MNDINWQNLNSNTMQALRYACQQLNLIQGKSKRELIATLSAYQQMHPEVSGNISMPIAEPVYQPPVNISPSRQKKSTHPKQTFQLPVIENQPEHHRKKQTKKIETPPKVNYSSLNPVPTSDLSPVWHPSTSSSPSPRTQKQIEIKRKKRTNFQLFTIILTIIAIFFVLYLILFN